jgi:hypothetical protein
VSCAVCVVCVVSCDREADVPGRWCSIGSAIKAIEALLQHGVKEEKILFLNLIAAPEGIKYATFPPTLPAGGHSRHAHAHAHDAQGNHAGVPASPHRHHRDRREA